MIGPDAYDYELPAAQIAQTPAARRGDARLLVVRGETLTHARADALPEHLPADALVVVNDSRVVPARLFPVRTDGRRFELLIADPAPGLGVGDPIHAWVRGAKRLQVGDRLEVDGLALRFEGADPIDPRARRFTVLAGDLMGTLETAGQIPLPPYIARGEGPSADDRQRYQTLYAAAPGSVAAPTAGLHWEPAILAALDLAPITLHVGPGTFLPMDVADVREHRVGRERYRVSEASAAKIEAARAAGRPIVAIGTTSTRALEAIAAAHDGRIVAGVGATDLVITPDHRFRVVDRLITNFHLPRSSLLMLVASLGGRERVMRAYREAVAAGYRFYSYGDCMVIDRSLQKPE
ncbi:MAG: tRNA preQ1(34) S-adenosylmethionine ribosyltransferase-isomerase QueA [Nannocystaceae bacterium]